VPLVRSIKIKIWAAQICVSQSFRNQDYQLLQHHQIIMYLISK